MRFLDEFIGAGAIAFSSVDVWLISSVGWPTYMVFVAKPFGARVLLKSILGASRALYMVSLVYRLCREPSHTHGKLVVHVRW